MRTRAASEFLCRIQRDRWDTLGKKHNDPIELKAVPLFANTLELLNSCTPLGSAMISKTYVDDALPGPKWVQYKRAARALDYRSVSLSGALS